MVIAVDWLARRARLSPEKVALIDTLQERRISYAAWNAQADRTARYLADLGVAKGDRVAVLATNSVEYLDIWFACNKLGSVLQNLNWRLAVPELERLVEDAAPRVLFYSGEFLETVAALQSSHCCASVAHYVAFGGTAADEHRRFAEREGYPAEPPPAPALSQDDPWVICYTGGTTGLPKGVILTHGNITWNAVNTVMSWGVGAEDTAILNAPLFHTGGLNVFTAPLVQAGGTSVVCQGFDPDQVFDWVASGEVSLYFGVPTMFQALQAHPRWNRVDFSPLKVVISGGAPCPQPVFERFWERGVDFKTGYGLTEAGPNTFWLPPEQVRQKPGAVGYPLFHVQVKLIDEHGTEVREPGRAGELLIRGPHRTPGYWNNPEATAEAIDADGWLHTGDLAERDADGAYTIVGRAKDMFISGGENVYPAEVESVIYGHEAVAEAAVFGVPDDRWGEVGCAVIALKPGGELEESGLKAFLRARLAPYKCPKHIHFVDALPKTGAGKIDKKALQAQYGG